MSRVSAGADEVVEGAVEEITYQSDDGQFSVVRFSSTKRDETFVAVGELGELAVGETLKLHGTWKTHASFGRQFRVRAFTPIVPTTRRGIARYLGSGLIPGIGKGLAKRLVDAFGDDTIEIIATQSSRLREVPGIGRRRADSIAEAVRKRRQEAEVMAFVHGVGLGPALGRKILKRYGLDAARVLRDDPYLVAEQVAGIGFRKADEIGRAVGIVEEDPRRAAGAALHVLARGADSGHVYMERVEIIDEAQKLGVPPARVDDAIDVLAVRGLVVLEGDDVYPPPLYHAEKAVAAQLAALARDRTPPPGIEAALSATQRDAVEAALHRGLMVLTGGPGTGKTTTVRTIVRALEALEQRVLLCAPTGRAAKRLSDATGTEASTIHRLLEWNPMKGGFARDAGTPLDAEVVLVDEASMLNLQLARSLFEAIPPSSRLILVGDVDQLPPVGPGQVLRELIVAEAAHVVRLDEVFRQAEQSAIVRGAHAILRGDAPPSSDGASEAEGDLFVIKAQDAQRIVDTLLRLMDRMKARYGLDPVEDVQVLTPMRRGPLGTHALNEALQKALNPRANTPGRFAAGDKVMQLRNDYDKDVFNGDLGTVHRVEGGITYVRVDGREVQYKIDDLDALTLAYASTVHKVQGSEFPACVVVLHNAHFVLLNRALLYTAVTRAKRLVVLLGDPRAIARAAGNALAYESHSHLARRLRNAAAD